MAEIVDDYFSGGWRDRAFQCPCDWHGNSKEMRMELQETVTDYACPQCEGTLLIVAHPDLERVRRAAADGNEEARSQLEIVEEAQRYFASRTPDRD